MKDVYGVLTKSPVCPQKFMSVEQMRLSPYFNHALWICEKLGPYNLMELHEDYNIHLVQQFMPPLCLCLILTGPWCGCLVPLDAQLHFMTLPTSSLRPFRV